MSIDTVQFIPAGGGPAYQVITDTMTIKLTGAQTGGGFALLEVAVPPGGGPPGLHTHPCQEVFHMIDGEIEFSAHLDGQVRHLRAGPGAVLRVPGGVPHGYRNLTTRPARFTVVVAPEGLEHFFAELGIPIGEGAAPPPPAGPPDMDRLLTLTRKYDIAFVES